jgi:hypothetical protein
MNSILRLIAWVWSIGWLSFGASALSNGDTARSWISVCCLAVGIGVDEFLEQRAEAARARQAHQVNRIEGRPFS